MCPACMTTAVLLATGATSAGGLIGFFAVKLRNRERVDLAAKNLSQRGRTP